MLRRLATTLVVVTVCFAVLQPWLPVHLSTITSGSMHPTMHDGDAYVVVETDDVAVGDVITFYSSTEDTYVTHRVVAARDGGYVTRGDTNPSTDQAAGHPLVTDTAVVGTVLTVHGSIVRVPYLGAVLLAVRAHLAAAFVVAAAIVAVAALRDEDTASPRVATTTDYLVPVLVASALVAFVAVLTATRDLSVVYVVTNSGTGGTVALGESVTRELVLTLEASPFTTVIVEPDGMRVLAQHADGEVRRLLVEYPAQTNVGAYDVRVRVFSYPRTLPHGVLSWLHGIDPLLAGAGSVLAGFTPVAVLSWPVLDDVPVRSPRYRWLYRHGRY